MYCLSICSPTCHQQWTDPLVSCDLCVEVLLFDSTWGENKYPEPVTDGWAGNSRLNTGIKL